MSLLTIILVFWIMLPVFLTLATVAIGMWVMKVWNSQEVKEPAPVITPVTVKILAGADTLVMKSA